MTGPAIRRGEVWWVAFDPAVGGEIRKTRPAVVVSNDDANEIQDRVQVVALTTNASRVRSWEAEVLSLGPPRKAMADQIRTVAKERLRQKLGAISDREMDDIEAAIRVQLAL